MLAQLKKHKLVKVRLLPSATAGGADDKGQAQALKVKVKLWNKMDALTLCAKAYAFLRGRGYVTPQDVKSIGMDVLRHRVTITYEAEAEEKTSETVIQKIFNELPVP